MLTCAQCGAELHPLEEFPGRRCLTCYTPEGERMVAGMTAGDLARMWGGR